MTSNVWGSKGHFESPGSDFFHLFFFEFGSDFFVGEFFAVGFFFEFGWISRWGMLIGWTRIVV